MPLNSGIIYESQCISLNYSLNYNLNLNLKKSWELFSHKCNNFAHYHIPKFVRYFKNKMNSPSRFVSFPRSFGPLPKLFMFTMQPFNSCFPMFIIINHTLIYVYMCKDVFKHVIKIYVSIIKLHVNVFVIVIKRLQKWRCRMHIFIFQAIKNVE